MKESNKCRDCKEEYETKLKLLFIENVRLKKKIQIYEDRLGGSFE